MAPTTPAVPPSTMDAVRLPITRPADWVTDGVHVHNEWSSFIRDRFTSQQEWTEFVTTVDKRMDMAIDPVLMGRQTSCFNNPALWIIGALAVFGVFQFFDAYWPEFNQMPYYEPFLIIAVVVLVTPFVTVPLAYRRRRIAFEAQCALFEQEMQKFVTELTEQHRGSKGVSYLLKKGTYFTWEGGKTQTQVPHDMYYLEIEIGNAPYMKK